MLAIHRQLRADAARGAALRAIHNRRTPDMTVERFPVEAGHVLTFARAIGDDNPVYRDPELAATSEVGGLIAPPTFTIASAQWDPDYPLRPKPGVPWLG